MGIGLCYSGIVGYGACCTAIWAMLPLDIGHVILRYGLCYSGIVGYKHVLNWDLKVRERERVIEIYGCEEDSYSYR